MPIKLIVGVRNPGPTYAQTRHNAGAWFVEQLAKELGHSFKLEKKLHAEVATISPESTQHTEKCYLVLPTTFMNHSGQPVQAISQFYRIKPEEILIAHDELDLPVGRIKLKTGGGHGGHNGLRDIIAQLGNPNFHRLRVGIGHPGHKDQVHNYVLTKPSLEDKIEIEHGIDRVISVAPTIFSGNVAKAMNELNG